MSSSGPRKRVVAAAAALLVGVGLLVTEVVVRLTLPYSTPETLRRYSVAYEGSVFTRYRLAPAGGMVDVDPDKAWGRAPRDGESERRFAINELGFRGPRFSPTKPEGTFRVFVVGGSAVFDQNVSDRSPTEGASWPNRAQRLLRERGLDVEVINGGTPAHSTIDALGRLISELWIYEPDAVVLYNAWNDIKNFRAWAITPDSTLAHIMTPFDPTADPFRNFQGPLDRLFGRSQLYMKFRTAVLSRRTDLGAEGYLPRGEVGTSYGPYGLRQFEQNVLNFVAVVRNMGATPVLMTQASPLAGGPLGDDAAATATAAAAYQLLDAEGLTRAYEDVHAVIRDVAREREADLLDAAEALGADPRWFSDHVHLTAQGSAAMARLLADHLEPLVRRRGGSPDADVGGDA